MNFLPTRPQLFFSKNDPQDARLGEWVKPSEIKHHGLATDDWAVLGYPDDDGIKLNGGRPGASEAPRTIRQFFYKMTLPMKAPFPFQMADLGDLEPVGELEVRHQLVGEATRSLFKNNIRLLSFGGGHDYGFPDCDSFVTEYKLRGQRPLVINFDAHLDVRPTTSGLNSGTPFYRLLEKHQNDFDFVEIGIQPQCNSIHHLNWALQKGATVFKLDEIRKLGGLSALFTQAPFQSLTIHTPIFISLDIDALTSSEAGGCSQAWVTGLKTQECLDFINLLNQKCDIRGLGIYEVSPPLDVDFRTSKTAALIAYHTLFQKYL